MAPVFPECVWGSSFCGVSTSPYPGYQDQGSLAHCSVMLCLLPSTPQPLDHSPCGGEDQAFLWAEAPTHPFLPVTSSLGPGPLSPPGTFNMVSSQIGGSTETTRTQGQLRLEESCRAEQ